MRLIVDRLKIDTGRLEGFVSVRRKAAPQAVRILKELLSLVHEQLLAQRATQDGHMGELCCNGRRRQLLILQPVTVGDQMFPLQVHDRMHPKHRSQPERQLSQIFYAIAAGLGPHLAITAR
jgi:hypothetical protein